MSDLDQTRLWQTLGELREAARQAAAQREELMTELKSLRAEQQAQRRDHERLINRGYGVVLGVGALAGSAGAAIKSILWSG